MGACPEQSQYNSLDKKQKFCIILLIGALSKKYSH